MTGSIVELMMKISEGVGRVEGMSLAQPSPKLRHNNRVRTVQGSVGIEGNTCSVAQVEAISKGRLVPVSELEQIEVRNALEAYAALSSFDPTLIDSLLSAHAQLMGGGLMPGAGPFRTGAVEVYITEHTNPYDAVSGQGARIDGRPFRLSPLLRRLSFVEIGSLPF